MIFLEHCDQADISEEEKHRVFSVILIGNEKQYYFDSLKFYNLNLTGLENAMKAWFQKPERTGALIKEWDEITPDKFIAINPDKTHAESL